jgi:hypothetical protein
MGDYATNADVYTRAPRLSSISSLTTTEIDNFIEQVEAEINSGLRYCGYTVPVTNTSDVAMLKRFVAEKSAAMSYHAAVIDETSPAWVVKYEEDYTAFLLRVRECKLALASTQTSTTGGISAGYFTLHSDMRFADNNEENTSDGE